LLSVAAAAVLIINIIIMMLYMLCAVQTVGWQSVAGEEVYWADVDGTSLRWRCKDSWHLPMLLNFTVYILYSFKAAL